MSIRRYISVTDAAGSFDLTTVAAVKADLGITGADEDAYLGVLIGRCSDDIASFCNRVFPVETLRESFYPQREYFSYQVPGGVNELQLSRWPVVSVSSVVENGATLVEGTDYLVDAENGLLTRLDGLAYPRAWPVWPVVVTYSAGFAAIPATVEGACARLVRARWFARARDPLIRSDQTEGIGRTDYWVSDNPAAGNLPPEIADALDNFRVPVIG